MVGENDEICKRVGSCERRGVLIATLLLRVEWLQPPAGGQRLYLELRPLVFFSFYCWN